MPTKADKRGQMPTKRVCECCIFVSGKQDYQKGCLRRRVEMLRTNRSDYSLPPKGTI